MECRNKVSGMIEMAMKIASKQKHDIRLEKSLILYFVNMCKFFSFFVMI